MNSLEEDTDRLVKGVSALGTSIHSIVKIADDLSDVMMLLIKRLDRIEASLQDKVEITQAPFNVGDHA